MKCLASPSSPKELLARILPGVSLAVLILLLSCSPTQEEEGKEEGKVASEPAWQARADTIEGRLPSQSHAMMDVAYHFSNLWFAAEKENWPLAEFYLGETKSHLRWAVRIIPVRKDPQNNPVDLQGILAPIENTHLWGMTEAIIKKDKARFQDVYRQTLEACYACHKTVGKPFLRPKVPDDPPERMIEFSPEAKWPQ